MIIPLGVDVPMERRPFVNWLMVFGITAIFFWQLSEPMETTEALCLNGLFSKGLFTHMWIHADIIHLFGNMLFLWVFGNAVCYKIGNLLYLPTFFILGIAAAITYLLYNSGLMLGASGAINGIVGMFLVFFPVNDITCVWFMFPFVRKFSLSSYWMILFWLMFDILGAMTSDSMVAYWAHLGGFAGGFGLAWLMLKTGFIKMNRFESSLFDIIKQQKHDEPQSASEAYASYLNEQAQADEQAWQQEAQTVETEQEPEIAPIPLYPTEKPEVIRFSCPCGKTIKTKLKNAGRKGKCPKCAQPITVPTM